ncbi:calreticulin [Xenopus laevis]|uniref:Calreticulin n=2 Tax=Xenopus laevis TaxID=8355 RepID=A0A1L8GME0_XENLA|nr:calreticulin [Xenopus laevis]XP_041446403.1 calreticulin [Xenopus laevis]OCT85008.1 hypothetical protein XELAEV_18023168mg [Xenopus laevis]
MWWCLLMAAALMAVSADPLIYFREQFEDGDEWQKRWTESKNKSDFGKFHLSAGKLFGDPEKDKGLQTSQDGKFYSISAKFEPFSNEGQTLVIQYTVQHEQGIDCGGGYVKLFPADMNQEELNGESQYYIMFGPDICGTIHEKVHVIFNYKGENHLIKKNITCKHDELTHLYTLIIRPNNTYEVKIDNENVENGTLEDNWDFLPPRKIKDPNATKPLDWDEREQIEDPNELRPEDWDETEYIPDPESHTPNDWDSSMDGEWEPPMIQNPKYKGIWKPKIIDNPNFQGEWIHPEIDNPDYMPDPNIYRYYNIGIIGLDLWQVKSGTIFDNFLITNNETFAERIGNETWGITKDPEMKMKEKQDAEKEAKEAQEEKEGKAPKWKGLLKNIEKMGKIKNDNKAEIPKIKHEPQPTEKIIENDEQPEAETKEETNTAAKDEL